MPNDMQDNAQDGQMKRIPIQKCRVCDVLAAAPAEEGNGNFFECALSKRLARVRLFGAVREVFVSEDKNYAFFVLDDTTGVVRCKAFGNTEMLTDIKAGQMVDVIGRIREYNNERYVMPEIVRVQTDPNIETLRWLEILKILKEKGINKDSPAIPAGGAGTDAGAEKAKKDAPDSGPKEEGSPESEKSDSKDAPKDARAKILEIISTENNGEGADYPSIVSLSGFPAEVVDAVLSELLSEGTCYEPRPGKVKVL